MASSSVIFIGAGNVATHLAKGFYEAGIDILQIVNRTKDKAGALANHVGAHAEDDLSRVRHDADTYIVAIKDDAIPQVAETLSLPSGMIAHTSGSVPVEALEGAAPSTGVCYPLQTFKADQQVNLSQVPFCLEANTVDALKHLKTLAYRVSENVHEIDSEQRKTIHIAAVFLNNFTNHMLACAEELMSKHNMDFDLLRPLLEETLQKVREQKPSKVQTGPAVRNDSRVIHEHLERLDEDPALQALYRSLTESIQRKQT